MLPLMNGAERSLSSTYVKEGILLIVKANSEYIYECDFGDLDGIYICKCGFRDLDGIYICKCRLHDLHM